MPYQRIYLDLDRTLLDTPRFSEAVFMVVEQAYNISAKDFQAGMPDFYVQRATMQYYDFFAHVATLGLDAKDVEQRVRGILQGGDYMYPDARHLLRLLNGQPLDVTVLSYGPKNYQHFKASLLPELQGFPFVATLQFKEDYLVEQTKKETLLVDDKIVQPLPLWCNQYIIDRNASATHTKEGERLWRINSLQAVETALGLGYNRHNQKET